MATKQELRRKSKSLVLGDRDVKPVDVTSGELSMMFLIYAKLVGIDQARMRRVYIKLANDNPQALSLVRAWYAERITFRHLVKKLAP